MNQGTIGIHCDKINKSSLTDSLKLTFAALKGSACAQIFTHGPRTAGQNKYDEAELTQICQKYNVYTHQTYLTSWKDEAKHLAHMQAQFTAAERIGAQGVVLHLAKLSPDDHIKVLKQLNPGGTKIILEMRALKPGQYSYQTAAEINGLCAALKNNGFTPDQVIICMDTAHLCAGGIELTTATDARAYIDSILYPEYIGLLHLNGNEYDPTKRAGDKHCTPLGKADFVFKNIDLASSGCLELVLWFVNRDRDVILEQDFTPELEQFYADLTNLTKKINA